MPALNSGHTVSYVRYPTFIRSFRVELSLEPVGCHDTDFTFTRSWASISDQSLYPGTLHQPPDPVNPTLLPAISQVEMDLAIAIKPELFDLSCQSDCSLLVEESGPYFFIQA